jgi:hypothetical protein
MFSGNTMLSTENVGTCGRALLTIQNGRCISFTVWPIIRGLSPSLTLTKNFVGESPKGSSPSKSNQKDRSQFFNEVIP